MKKTLSLALAFVMQGGVLVFASDISKNAGTRSAALLNDSFLARSQSMGGGGVALVQGASALGVNPAGLGEGSRAQVFAGFGGMVEDTQSQNLSFSYPLAQGGGTLALGVTRLDAGSLDARSVSGEPLGEKNLGGMAVSLGYGGRIGGYGFGLALKQVREDLGGDHGQGTALDVGIRQEGDVLSWGVAGRNLASRYRAGSVTDKFAEEWRFGLASRPAFLKGRGLAALDFVNAVDREPRFQLGGEYRIGSVLALRGGYDWASSGGPSSGASLGFGLATGGGSGGGSLGSALAFSRSFSFDYAFLPQEVSGGQHKVTVGFQF